MNIEKYEKLKINKLPRRLKVYDIIMRVIKKIMKELAMFDVNLIEKHFISYLYFIIECCPVEGFFSLYFSDNPINSTQMALEIVGNSFSFNTFELFRSVEADTFATQPIFLEAID